MTKNDKIKNIKKKKKAKKLLKLSEENVYNRYTKIELDRIHTFLFRICTNYVPK